MANEYTVLRIMEMVRPSDIRGVETFYRHTIKTKGGVVLNVDIDQKDFTPEKTAPLLAEAAKNADKILKL